MPEDSKNFFDRLFKKKEQKVQNIQSEYQDTGTPDEVYDALPPAMASMSDAPTSLIIKGVKQKDELLNYQGIAPKDDRSLDERIKDEVALGNLPSDREMPKDIYDLIKNGKATLEQVVFHYQKQVAREDYAKNNLPKNYDKKKYQVEFDNKYNQIMEQAAGGIKDLVLEDRLPLDKTVIDRLKNLPQEIPKALQAYEEYKKSSSFYAQPELIGDKIEAMKNEGFDMTEASKWLEENHSRTDFYFDKFVSGATFGIIDSGKEPVYYADTFGGPIAEFAPNIFSYIALEKLVGFGLTKLGPRLGQAFEAGANVASKAATVTEKVPGISKITRGTYNVLKSGEGISNFSQLKTGAAEARKVAKEMYLLGRSAEAIGSTQEAYKAYKAASKFKKIATGKDILKLGVEQAGVGGIVGTAKGAVRYASGEEDIDEAVGTALTEAAFYPLTALTMVGGSKIIGKTGNKLLNLVGDDATKSTTQYLKGTGDEGVSNFVPSIRKKAYKDNQILTQYLSNEQVKKAAEMGVSENFLKKTVLTDLPIESQLAINAMNKIEIMKSYLDVPNSKTTQAQLLSKPELLKESFVSDMAETANKIFKEEGAPLNFLYSQNKNIQDLVDSGLNIQALNSVRSEMALNISNGNLKPIDILDGAIPVDHDLITKMLSDKVVSSRMPSLTKSQKDRLKRVPEEARKIIDERFPNATPQQMDQIEESLKSKILAEGKEYSGVKQKYSDRKDQMYNAVYKYIDDPTEESLKNLEQVANAPKKVTSRKGVVYEGGQKRVKFFKTVLDDIEKAKVGMLTGEEVNDLVNDQVHRWFKNAGGRVTPETATFMDADQLMSAMIVKNQKLMETTAEAFQRSSTLRSEGFFGSIKGEEAQGLKEALRLRDMEYDLSLSMQAYNKTKIDLDDLLKNTEADPLQIFEFKTRLKKHLTKQSDLKRDIRESRLVLDSFTTAENPNGTSDILEKASDIWSPHMSMYRKPGTSLESATEAAMVPDKQVASDALQTNKKNASERVIDSGSGKDMDYLLSSDSKSPFYIKRDSALQKELSALMVSGSDFSATYSKAFSKAGFSKMANALKKELGEESAVANFLVDEFKNKDIAANEMKVNYFKEIKSLGLRSKTKESRLVHFLGEKHPNDYKMHPEFQSLSLAQQQKVESGIKWFRNTYDDLHNKMNQAAKDSGNLAVSFRENYFPHLHDGNDLKRVFQEFGSGATKDYELVFDKSLSNKGSSKVYFNHRFQRTTDDTIYDAVGNFERYIDGATRMVHFQDYLRQVDTMMEFAPKNFRELLKNIKEEKVLRVSEIDNAVFEPKGLAKKSIRYFDNLLTKGVLAFKITSMANQVSSSAFAFAESTPDALKSVIDLNNPLARKEVNRILGMSKNLKVRSSQVGGMDDLKGPFTGLLRKIVGEASDKSYGKNAAIKTANFVSQASVAGLEYFDKAVVKHLFLSTYKKGIRSGLNEQASAKMADYAADKFHADLSKMGRMAYQNSSLGRALTRFSTFTNNLFFSLMTDIPRLEQKEGTAAMISNVMRLAASMEIANEVYSGVGMPRPFELNSLVPFLGNVKYGTSGVFGLLGDAMKYVGARLDVLPKKNELEKTKKYLIKDAWNAAGVGQILRAGEASLNLLNGEYDYYDDGMNLFLQDFVLGEKSRKYLRKEQKALKKMDEKYTDDPSLMHPRKMLKGKIIKSLSGKRNMDNVW